LIGEWHRQHSWPLNWLLYSIHVVIDVLHGQPLPWHLQQELQSAVNTACNACIDTPGDSSGSSSSSSSSGGTRCYSWDQVCEVTGCCLLLGLQLPDDVQSLLPKLTPDLIRSEHYIHGFHTASIVLAAATEAVPPISPAAPCKALQTIQQGQGEHHNRRASWEAMESVPNCYRGEWTVADAAAALDILSRQLGCELQPQALQALSNLEAALAASSKPDADRAQMIANLVH
jgi:hypothetical protein